MYHYAAAMQMKEFVMLLRKNGYRDTQPRRMVMEALHGLQEPSSPYDLQKWITGQQGNVSIVTVYRVLGLFQQLGLVHKQPCSGKLALCEHPGENGLHGYLHCHDCGNSEEFCSRELSAAAGRQASSRGFKASSPLLEIVGSCKGCSQ